ncbi:MAG: TetR/AcrR family transcriptional regulator [Pseudomonadota bacterium]
MAAGTREKIVETALRVFNEQGFGNVSLADLAGEAGIAKGNLWYHFNDKRALLEALNKAYIERIEYRRTIWPEAGRELEGFAHLLRTIADEIRDFRFMFRDQASYGEHSPALEAALAKIYSDVMAQFRAFYEAMRAAGLLNLSDEELDPLVFNTTIGLRFHLEFLRELGRDSGPKAGAVRSALLQCFSLFEARLSEEARSDLKDLLLTDAQSDQRAAG